MQNLKVLWGTILLAVLGFAVAVVVDQRTRSSRKLAEARAGAAERVAAMQPMSAWTPEEVNRFLLDVPKGGEYDWVLNEAKATPDSYRDWYERGDHRMRLPEDRHLEPAFAKETIGRVAACLRTGDFGDASYYLDQAVEDLAVFPYHPRPPSR